MNGFIKNYPKLKEPYYALKIAFMAFFMFSLLDIFLKWFYESNTTSVVLLFFIPIPILLILLGVRRKYSWAEIFAMVFIGFSSPYFIQDAIYSSTNVHYPTIIAILSTIISLVCAISSLTIFVLLFKIRFDRSKEMTDDFVKYQ